MVVLIIAQLRNWPWISLLPTMIWRHWFSLLPTMIQSSADTVLVFCRLYFSLLPTLFSVFCRHWVSLLPTLAVFCRHSVSLLLTLIQSSADTEISVIFRHCFSLPGDTVSVYCRHWVSLFYWQWFSLLPTLKLKSSADTDSVFCRHWFSLLPTLI